MTVERVERVLSRGRERGVGSYEYPLRPVEMVDPGVLADWRGDVALELWVDSSTEPARVWMAGRLDASTAANLTQVIQELLDDGTREVDLCTDGLQVVDSSALGALADVEHLVSGHGGTLVRVGPTKGPFTRPLLRGTSATARGTRPTGWEPRGAGVSTEQ